MMKEISLTGATLLSDDNDADENVMDPLLSPSKKDHDIENNLVEMTNVTAGSGGHHHHNAGCKHHNHSHNPVVQSQAALDAMTNLMMSNVEKTISKKKKKKKSGGAAAAEEEEEEDDTGEKSIVQTLWTLVRLGRYEPFEKLWTILENKVLKEQQENGITNSKAVNLKYLYEMDDNGHLLLHWAAKRVDETRFMKFLLEKASQKNVTSSDPTTAPVKTLVELVTAQSKDSSGMTCIHWACTESEFSIRVLALIFQYAIQATGSNKIVSELIETKDKSGCTPLLIAAQHGQVQVVAYLIEKGANLRATDDMLDTAMHWAAYKGSIQVIGLLLHYYYQKQQQMTKGIGIMGDMEELSQDEKSDIAASIFMMADSYGQTPLHLAALRGNTSVVRYLLYQVAGGYSHNINNSSNTLLSTNKKLIRQWLLMKDKNSRTPYDLAVHKSRPNVTKILYMADQETLSYAVNTGRKNKIPSTQVILGHIKSFFSIESWKLWMGFNTTRGVDEVDEVPKFPYYYMWAHILFQFFIVYPFIFAPIFNISNGLLWDYTTWHMFNFFLMVFSMVTLVKVKNTDPGRLIDQNSTTATASKNNKSNNNTNKINIQRWKHLYQNTLRSYTTQETQFGVLSQHKVPLCHTCHIARPLRSKHCRVARCCVLVFDHHCPFVDNTVGLYNYKYFYLFVVGLASYLLGFCFNYGLYIHRYINQHSDSESSDGTHHYSHFLWVFILVGFFVALHALPAAGMLFYHTQLMMVNLTTNEHANISKYDYLFQATEPTTTPPKNDNPNSPTNQQQYHPKRKYKNPWFKSLLRNFLDRFSPNESLYLLPTNLDTSSAHFGSLSSTSFSSQSTNNNKAATAIV